MGYYISGSSDGPAVTFLAGKLGGPWYSWINLTGLIFVVLLLIPNIVFAVRRTGQRNLCDSLILNILEQVGRYGSMVFMILCFKEGGYGFSSETRFLIYMAGNIILLIAYFITWGIYFYKTKSQFVISRHMGPTAFFLAGKPSVRNISAVKVVLAILPSLMFLISGFTLEYIPLIICAIFFAQGHISVTYENIRKSTHRM